MQFLAFPHLRNYTVNFEGVQQVYSYLFKADFFLKILKNQTAFRTERFLPDGKYLQWLVCCLMGNALSKCNFFIAGQISAKSLIIKGLF